MLTATFCEKKTQNANQHSKKQSVLPTVTTDQAIKALQAQNAQFQEMFMNLAKGHQDLKTLILKDKKKNKKKKKVLLNMGHRFGNNLRDEVNLSDSSGGGENQEERRAPSPVVSDNETDFDEDQYPPAEDR